MGESIAIKTTSHVVDILGNVIGRDQPIMLMEKALELVSHLDEKIFLDDDVVFFDPFCKAGEILLACAFARCRASAKTTSHILDVDYVQNELYESSRYFALAPDERHHRLSLRTFLGNTNSHNEKYNHIIRDGHYLSEVDGRIDKEQFEREFNSMLEYIKKTSKKKKIIAVGNPPYQESDGGAQSSAKPVYNYFVEMLMNTKAIDEFVLVIPARWFSAGKGLDPFRDKIRKSKTIKSIRYFEKAEEVFPTVQVKGGICFLHEDKSYSGETSFLCLEENHLVNLEDYDIIPDDPAGTSVVEKIRAKPNMSYVSSIAWSRKPFGLATDYFRSGEGKLVSPKSEKAVPCYTNLREVKVISKDAIQKNKDKIDEWKVAIPGAYGRGMSRCTLRVDHFFIIKKGEVTTETYNIVGSFKTKGEAENFIAYLRTDFARYLLGLRKLTQHIPKDRWDWTPIMDNSKTWTDQMLYEHFDISKKEQAHIAKKIKEWS